MTDAERLQAVIRENNALRKNTERLRNVEKENARLRGLVEGANARAGQAAMLTLHHKSRDEAMAKSIPVRLANEWNAALEAAAGEVEASGVVLAPLFAERIRALKREPK